MPDDRRIYPSLFDVSHVTVIDQSYDHDPNYEHHVTCNNVVFAITRSHRHDHPDRFELVRLSHIVVICQGSN